MSPKDDLNEGNVCGHCGEALTKLTEFSDRRAGQAIRPYSIDRLAGKLGDPSQLLEQRAL